MWASSFILSIALLTMVSFQPASAQTAPTLGTAQSFAVLGASTVTNTGPSVITGDLGVSPGTAVTGFPPGTVVGGSIHAADAVALQAQADNTNAYNVLAGEACNTTYGVPTDIGGMTLTSGVYCFASSAGLTGTVTLDAQGDPNAVFIFKIGSTLITASNANVLLINGASACNVFWQVGSSATLGTGTTFVGNILALTSITLTTNATLSGRALAQNGAVTLDSNIVSVSSCGGATVVPPTVNKAFSPANITAGGTSVLTITLSNANGNAASLTSPLVDSLPTGVTVSAPGTTTCGGTLTGATGSSTVMLTGGTIPTNGSCTVTVNVTAPAAGSFINSLAAGALQTSNGNNVVPAVATLTATAPANVPPTVNKAFSPATVVAGAISTLTITLDNPAAVVADLTAPFTDSLPTGMDISGNASTTCGGSLAAAAGTSTITLTGGAIPANGSCTVTVDVTAPVAGSYFNALAAGSLQTSNGNNTAPAVATLTVNALPVVAPTLSKAFSPATITSNGVSTLTITLNNSDGVAANLTAPFTDTFPSGIVVSGSAITTCGGTLTANAGGSSIVLTGGAIPAGSSCTVKVNVVGVCSAGTTSLVKASAVRTGGIQPNWVSNNQCTLVNTLPVGALQTSNGSNSASANATLVVNATAANLPELLNNFVPGYIDAGANSTLTITLYNTSGSTTSLTSPLIDSLTNGMTVSGSPSTTCSGGGVSANIGGSSVTLTGGSIPAYGTCLVTVNVTAPCTTTGQCTYVNTMVAGALQTDHGSNSQPTSATLVVTPVPPPTLLVYFDPASIVRNGNTALIINLRNTADQSSSLTAPFTDNLPNGVRVSGISGTSCGGQVTATVGGSIISLSGGSIAAYGSCQVGAYVTAGKKGTYTNTIPAGALKTNTG
ncbi:MAG: ice-binding family protein, partial [Acidobacteriaceae bacterium]